MDGMQWASTQGIGFAVPAGYFLGPDPRKPDRPGMFGPPPRHTADVLAKVAKTGQVPTITESDRRRAVEDLRYWRAAIVVLAPRKNAAPLSAATTDLLGFPPTWIDGAWVWDVRPLTS
jgi:dolichyl-phosphate beta-glucosyltransferase